MKQRETMQILPHDLYQDASSTRRQVPPPPSASQSFLISMPTEAQAMAQIAPLWGANSPMQDEDMYEDEEPARTPRPKALRLGFHGDGRVEKRRREGVPRSAPAARPPQARQLVGWQSS